MDQSLFMIPLEVALDGIDDLQGDKNPEEPIKTMDTDAKVLSEQAMDHKNMKNGEWQRENGDEKKRQKAHPQPYSRAGRVEVEWLRKTPVVFTPTRLGVEPRTFSIYDVGVPGESRCLLSIPLDHTRCVAIERRRLETRVQAWT
jgi:hypothetical protein